MRTRECNWRTEEVIEAQSCEMELRLAELRLTVLNLELSYLDFQVGQLEHQQALGAHCGPSMVYSRVTKALREAQSLHRFWDSKESKLLMKMAEDLLRRTEA
jgi:radical SAM superfamily enzyme